jgi:hypothetical protein
MKKDRSQELAEWRSCERWRSRLQSDDQVDTLTFSDLSSCGLLTAFSQDFLILARGNNLIDLENIIVYLLIPTTTRSEKDASLFYYGT